MRHFGFALAAGLALAFPTTAQTGQEIAGARLAIERFEAAFEAGEYSELLSAMPPRLFDRIASQSGVTPEALLAQLDAQMTAMMSQVTFEDFSMDLAGATWGETPSGLTYALVPTRTILRPPGSGRMRSTTTTLALHEGGTWYLVRIDTAQQVNLLQAVYPEFAGVTFPNGSMEALD